MGNRGLASTWGCSRAEAGEMPSPHLLREGQGQASQQALGRQAWGKGVSPTEALLPAAMDQSQLFHGPPAKGIQVWCLFGAFAW